MACLRRRPIVASRDGEAHPVELPDFGMPDSMPELPAALYGARVERLRERAEAGGYNRLVIYADREHSANVAYLTGFDPRFEEAILIVGPSGEPRCSWATSATRLARPRCRSGDTSSKI